MYETRLMDQPDDVDAILGCIHCLSARGDWKRVLELAKTSWSAITDNDDGKQPVFVRGNQRSDITALQPRDHRKAFKYCAQAAWRLGKWDDLEKFASQLGRGSLTVPLSSKVGNHGTRLVAPRVDFDGAIYSAVLHIKRQEWSMAADPIVAARQAMESRFTALMSESYKRAYPNMVIAQTLAEMEEIIAYLQLRNRAVQDTRRHSVNKADPMEARSRLLSVWRKRLIG
jgi:FKBP12-rapamycin complex-associated protein